MRYTQAKHYIWNTTANAWILSDNAVNEIGCVHTSQGYDLNYVAVVFGHEIDYDPQNNTITIDRSKFFDVGRYLFTHHTGYDLAETDVVSNAETENGKLRIGKAEYGTVIVIAGGEKEEKVYDEINGKVNTVLFNGNLNDIPLSRSQFWDGSSDDNNNNNNNDNNDNNNSMI